MREIRNIVIHCSAGHKDAQAIQDYFKRPVSKGGRGWKTGGYHIVIEKDGKIVQLYPFDTITNGVKGHNTDTIHICYVGGVDPNNLTKAQDTRTDKQKASLHTAIQRAIEYAIYDGGPYISLGVVGHRDFSDDKNSNGVIESWERIKECPSFDALQEYSALYASPDRYNKLPTI